MNIGTGWLIIEESYHTNTNTLISIISTRKQESYVLEYLEQMYIDKYASLDEKISHKKNTDSWPYRANPVTPLYQGVLSCGHDPVMMAYRCHKLNLKKEILEYTFKTLQGQTKDFRPIFKEITRKIKVT